MPEIGKISIEKRVSTNSNANKKLRRLGFLPGVVSSKGKESIHLSVKSEDLRRGISIYGRNALFDLLLDGKKSCTVMIKDIQNNPVKGDMLHVDFQEVFMDEEIKADLGIRIKGTELLESKRLLLLRQMDLIPVKGLPQLIPDDIEIDVTELGAGDSINVKDINFPEGIVPDCELDQVVVSVTGAKTVTETEEADETDEINENI